MKVLTNPGILLTWNWIQNGTINLESMPTRVPSNGAFVGMSNWF